jgi:hypothetical protein
MTQPRHCEGRKRRSNPICPPRWIASRSLSSGARSRDPLARNDVETHVLILATGFRPSFSILLSLSDQRAQGKPGGQCTRSLACRKKKAHERSHHRFTGTDPAFPAQWFYGLLRDLPGDQALLSPSPARLLADLTPGLGRQNHTTWPYASASFVRLAIARLTLPRPPHPAPRS